MSVESIKFNNGNLEICDEQSRIKNECSHQSLNETIVLFNFKNQLYLPVKKADKECEPNLTIVSHDFLDEGQFACTYCNKRFKFNSKLKRHIRIHTGIKPFHCDYCSSTFSQIAGLRRHLITHTGKTSYQCSICNQYCSSSVELKRHCRTHTDEGFYQCEYCTKSYMQLRSLKRHVLQHPFIKTYKCKQCESSFPGKIFLEAHSRQHKRQERNTLSYGIVLANNTYVGATKNATANKTNEAKKNKSDNNENQQNTNVGVNVPNSIQTKAISDSGTPLVNCDKISSQTGSNETVKVKDEGVNTDIMLKDENDPIVIESIIHADNESTVLGNLPVRSNISDKNVLYGTLSSDGQNLIISGNLSNSIVLNELLYSNNIKIVYSDSLQNGEFYPTGNEHDHITNTNQIIPSTSVIMKNENICSTNIAENEVYTAVTVNSEQILHSESNIISNKPILFQDGNIYCADSDKISLYNMLLNKECQNLDNGRIETVILSESDVLQNDSTCDTDQQNRFYTTTNIDAQDQSSVESCKNDYYDNSGSEIKTVKVDVETQHDSREERNSVIISNESVILRNKEKSSSLIQNELLNHQVNTNSTNLFTQRDSTVIVANSSVLLEDSTYSNELEEKNVYQVANDVESENEVNVRMESDVVLNDTVISQQTDIYYNNIGESELYATMNNVILENNAAVTEDMDSTNYHIMLNTDKPQNIYYDEFQENIAYNTINNIDEKLEENLNIEDNNNTIILDETLPLQNDTYINTEEENEIYMTQNVLEVDNEDKISLNNSAILQDENSVHLNKVTLYATMKNLENGNEKIVDIKNGILNQSLILEDENDYVKNLTDNTTAYVTINDLKFHGQGIFPGVNVAGTVCNKLEDASLYSYNIVQESLENPQGNICENPPPKEAIAILENGHIYFIN